MKKNLGKKHICHECGCKFYDLGKPEPTCPRCGRVVEDQVEETLPKKTVEDTLEKELIEVEGDEFEEEEEEEEEEDYIKESSDDLDEDSYD